MSRVGFPEQKAEVCEFWTLYRFQAVVWVRRLRRR